MTTAMHSPRSLADEWVLPLVRLLSPGPLALPSLVALGAGLAGAWFLRAVLGRPLWMGAATVLLVLLPVGVAKWREDRRRYGAAAMLLSVLLVAQGFHTVEHLAQWAEYYVLLWPARQSSGLISPANAEWVHFVWNWLVMAVVLALARLGMRGAWAWLLVAVAGLHTLEHTYLFVRYYQVLAELRSLDVLTVTAQGLPGIVGRDGWLARSPLTQNTFVCTLPGLTTAMRLDVHFWWNMIEMTLLLAAGAAFLRGRIGPEGAPAPRGAPRR